MANKKFPKEFEKKNIISTKDKLLIADEISNETYYCFVDEIVSNASVDKYGLVKQAMASPDMALEPSITYSQEEIQSIINELRDLKIKLRLSGILEI